MKLIIAGQAVYEGVMMHSRNFIVISVRSTDGSVVTTVREARCGRFLQRWMRVPFVRGLVALYESISCGFLGLRESLELRHERSRLSARFAFAIELPIGLAIGFSIFVIIPHVLADGFRGVFLDGDVPVHLYGVAHFSLNLIEGVARLLVFVSFIAAVRLLPGMRSYFAYHGAEHKAINTYESGNELTVEELMRQPRLHARCGTTFTLTVFMIAIVLFSLIPWTSISVRLVGRVLLLPAVAGLSYEVMLAGIFRDAMWAKAITSLGVQIQRLTTAEPSVQQLEVALVALTSLLRSEEAITP
ncbi:MAG: DUF1385 domain-containing protein [Armatimonadota bacterium]|nr:DUF1385 domain-containing protein [Armatimonadota bacterium]MCX7777085.1 DUF1385 domain-containing protein [Armatimonadota bacterium]MDW8025132.1 DUF1385 domain-containing protein [Armatimonadota bacterium]